LESCWKHPIIAESAFKHGLTKDDILHAYRNPIRIWDLGDGFTMMIGPNEAAIILEVGYVRAISLSSSFMQCRRATSS